MWEIGNYPSGPALLSSPAESPVDNTACWDVDSTCVCVDLLSFTPVMQMILRV